MTRESRTCSACGSATSAGANFCPNCGQSLGPGAADVSYTHSPPRLFGVLAPGPTFVFACLVLVGAIVAFVAGSLILGIVLLAASASVFVLFYGAAERDSSSGVARRVLTTRDRIREWTRFTTGSARAWARAGRDLFRLRRELHPLRREREQVQLALGDAAYREDEAAVASLRARLQEIDEAVSARERARAEALASARRRVAGERLAVQETRELSADELESEQTD